MYRVNGEKKALMSSLLTENIRHTQKKKIGIICCVGLHEIIALMALLMMMWAAKWDFVMRGMEKCYGLDVTLLFAGLENFERHSSGKALCFQTIFL